MPRRAKSQAPKSSAVPQSRFANANGVRLHYLFAGKGEPVVLLHGYAETSHMTADQESLTTVTEIVKPKPLTRFHPDSGFDGGVATLYE